MQRDCIARFKMRDAVAGASMPQSPHRLVSVFFSLDRLHGGESFYCLLLNFVGNFTFSRPSIRPPATFSLNAFMLDVHLVINLRVELAVPGCLRRVVLLIFGEAFVLSE